MAKAPRKRLQSKLSAGYRKSNGQQPNTSHWLKIRREIAILKKCRHPHVVGLKEVINDAASDKIYLILEYMPGGEVVWLTADDPPQPAMSIQEAQSVFRDMVSGICYLHANGILHR